MNYGKVEERSSSRRRSLSTARFAATSAIPTAISSRSARAQTSHTVDARPGWEADFKAFGCPLRRPIGSNDRTRLGRRRLQRALGHLASSESSSRNGFLIRTAERHWVRPWLPSELE